MSDLIRREDVITVLCFCEETKMMLCGDLRKILEKINEIPSAEPERKWISVTEALPEEDIDVLLQFPHTMGVGYQEDGFWNIITCDDLYCGLDEADAKPIAWMPLPEPYRGEQ